MVAAYIAGFVCKTILLLLRCEECKQALVTSDPTQNSYDCSFIKFISKGKLITPSNDVVKIGLASEKYLKINPFTIKVQNVINNICLNLFGNHVFKCVDDHFRTCDPMNNNSCLLMKCIMSVYIESRLCRYSL